MPKEIAFKDVYDEIYDLMSADDPRFPKKPALWSRSMGLEGWADTHASFKMREMPGGDKIGAPRPLEPSKVTYNPGTLERKPGVLRSEHLKNLRYVAAHELAHAKDFENLFNKLSPEDYRKFERSLKPGNEVMRQVEKRGAQIHMPFLAKTFGRDALPIATKNSLIWREVIGKVMREGEETVPNWKIVAEANERSRAGVRNKRVRMGDIKPLLKNLGGTTSTRNWVYKDLAKIARKHGLLGLLMATMLTAGAGMSKDE